jgi:hypothetical protein
MIGFISTSVTNSLNHNYYSVIADLHKLQFTVIHALGFSVFTSRLVATDLNAETSTPNHSEVFLLFLVQSPCNLETQPELSCTAFSVFLEPLKILRHVPSNPTYSASVFLFPWVLSLR